MRFQKNKSSVLVVTLLTRSLFFRPNITAMLTHILTQVVFLLAFPLVASQEADKIGGGSGSSYMSTLAGVAAVRVVRDVTSQILGACPSYCVEGDLYAVSRFLSFVFFSLTPSSSTSVRDQVGVSFWKSTNW